MAISNLQTLPSHPSTAPYRDTDERDIEARPRLRPVPSRLVQSFSRGQALPLKAGHIWVIQDGVVLLNTLYPSGDEALLGLAGPGSPVGLPLTMVDPYQALAFCDVQATSYSMVEVEHSPRLLQDVCGNLRHRLQQAEMMVALLGQRRVEERLRQFLQLLAAEMGQPVEGGIRLNLRLTHQHLANALGTTRVTVTRILNQLRSSGWLRFDQGRHIVISGS